ncbi:hypothetical protein [Devosia rhizoryzae]|uniref:Uncharacterized protein n=1 Tax=Devosia rhizoryzae TaxID=2774137 RepID=A0ABX7C463_9HYPH|nr:hypothetical protein [Devosia rhizoryzae]QQR39018.1 hypothetical protein JI748_14920 [Devosia rhizoryzae]
MSDSLDGHTWQISRLANNGNASLDLLVDSGSPAKKAVAQCASIAEARIIATCLENADDIELPDLAEQASELGLRELQGFPDDVADEIIGNLLRHGHDSHRYKRRARRWFGNDEVTYLMTVDETNHFPVYGFRMGDDRIVRPDFVYMQPRPLRQATAAAFAFGQMEILMMRRELHGSIENSLRGDQHHDLVDRFEDGYYGALENSYRI